MKISGLIAAGLLILSVNSFAAAPSVYTMTVTEKGYEPSILKVKAGEPAILKITRKTNATCAREITIPSQKIKVDLPLDKEVQVKLPNLAKGEVKFGCAMNLMIGGVMNVE
jgi:plastocyanin domain-containing protein